MTKAEARELREYFEEEIDVRMYPAMYHIFDKLIKEAEDNSYAPVKDDWCSLCGEKNGHHFTCMEY